MVKIIIFSQLNENMLRNNSTNVSCHGGELDWINSGRNNRPNGIRGKIKEIEDKTTCEIDQ